MEIVSLSNSLLLENSLSIELLEKRHISGISRLNLKKMVQKFYCLFCGAIYDEEEK